MDRIKGLREYIRRDEFLEQLNIPKDEKIDLKLLAQGEYNINYLFTHPTTKEKLILSEYSKSNELKQSNRIWI